MAYFVVRTPDGLTPEQLAEALEDEQAFLHPRRPYPELMAEAGFTDVTEDDVTDAYRRTVECWLAETATMEPELRAAWGDEIYDDKLTRRRRHATRAAAGLVGRSLVVGRA